MRKPSVRWSCSHRKKKLRSSPWIPSIKKTLTIVLLTADEVGKVPVVVVKDGLEVFDKFLDNIFHHCASVLVPCPFAQENLRRW